MTEASIHSQAPGDDPPRVSRGVLCLTEMWTAAGVLLFLFWPALAPVLLPLCLILPMAWYWRTDGRMVWFGVSGVSVILLSCVVYAVINASWSMARDEALSYAAMLLVVVICLHIGLGTLTRIAFRPAIKAMAIGFYVGFALAGSFLCFEILSNHATFFRLMSTFPDLWPQARTYLAEGALPPHFLNHRIAALAILLWPAALTAMRLGSTSWGRGILLGGFGPSVLAVAASEHATSLVAMVMGACVVAVSCWSWRAAQRLLMLAWIIACLAVVPLCLAAYAANVHRLPWLAPSAQDRFVIWKATSDLIPSAPLLGVGIHSGRPLTRAEIKRRIAPGTPFALSVGWHSHNAFLQVWFETGALGAGLLLCFGLSVLRNIGLQDMRVRPALFAAFATCTMIAATGFSAFAPWLTASFAISALFAGLASAESI